MVFILVIIYGILFIMKNNQIINTIESFETSDNINVSETNLPLILNGNWTSFDSNPVNPDDTTSGNLSNTLEIKMPTDSKNGTMAYKGKKFTIKIKTKNTIETNEIDGIRYNFIFNSDYKYKNYNTTPSDVFSMVMIPIKKNDDDDDSEKLKNSLIFKFNTDGKLNKLAFLMITKDQIYQKKNSFFSTPLMNNIKKYKFRNDAVIGIYESIPSGDEKFIDTMKEKYDNYVPFQILRKFKFSENQDLFTPFSQVYNLKYIDGDKILTSVKINKLKSELNENKLSGRFYDITTYVYLFKVTNFVVDYNFTKPNINFTQRALKLKNGAQNNFEYQLGAPNIRSVQRENISDFTPMLIKTINNYNPNNMTESITIDTTIKNIKNNI